MPSYPSISEKLSTDEYSSGNQRLSIRKVDESVYICSGNVIADKPAFPIGIAAG